MSDFVRMCGGGPDGSRPDGSGPMEACGEVATWRMPYRSVFPQMGCCDRHARNWNGGREPRVDPSDYYGEHSWRQVAS